MMNMEIILFIIITTENVTHFNTRLLHNIISHNVSVGLFLIFPLKLYSVSFENLVVNHFHTSHLFTNLKQFPQSGFFPP